MNGIKINQLEIENVKRIKAVKIEPSASGLTIIGGDNNQGKTSVLDAIAWALGGDRYRPCDGQWACGGKKGKKQRSEGHRPVREEGRPAALK